MRVILAIAGAAVALSLSGCDMRGGDQKPAKVDCNCTMTPPPVAATTPPPDMRGGTAYMPPEPRYRGHRRHYRGGGYARWSGHSYYWRREYSEISVATYDYRSGSTSTYFGGGGEHGDDRGGGEYHPVEHGWIDGYGRGHGGGSGGAGHDGHGDDGRGHVWHGYDADCPDDPHAHR